MDHLKPRITHAGYKKALSEYGNEPNRIVEELVANSYDADSTDVAIVYSNQTIMVIDNGKGISNAQFPKLLDLGAGTKLEQHDSRFKRSYLGAFGFGIKSTVNISREISILTINKESQLTSHIDVEVLSTKGFDQTWPGFDVEESQNDGRRGQAGTIVLLQLKDELTIERIEAIRNSLNNLPKAKEFRVFFVPKKKAPRCIQAPCYDAIRSLTSAAKMLKKERVTGSLDIGEPNIRKCVLPGSDTIDVAVWCKGLDSKMKVPSLGHLAGVYVKVDGRVLKRNFQGEKILDGVSKFPKFKHGMRIEVPVDWVKDQISLGRDGLQFGNESSRRKFENELKSAVSFVVRPFAKQLEVRKGKAVSKALDLRIRKAKERIEEKQSIKSLEETGYSFSPRDDYEMALLIANPAVLKKLNRNWMLMDFNGQLDFDCLIYDRKTGEYHRVELEPELECFIGQSILGNTEFVITWTRGKWKVGKTKPGKNGVFELRESKDGPGHYKLLHKANERSKGFKKELPVYCLDKIIQQ